MGIQIVWANEWPCPTCGGVAPFVASWGDLFAAPQLRLAAAFPGWTPDFGVEGAGASLPVRPVAPCQQRCWTLASWGDFFAAPQLWLAAAFPKSTLDFGVEGTGECTYLAGMLIMQYVTLLHTALACFRLNSALAHKVCRESAVLPRYPAEHLRSPACKASL